MKTRTTPNPQQPIPGPRTLGPAGHTKLGSPKFRVLRPDGQEVIVVVPRRDEDYED